MFRLASLWNFPCATNIISLDISGRKARVTCDMQGGRTAGYAMSIPCVLGAGRGLNTPKYPTFPDVVKEKKKPILRIEMDTLSFETPDSEMKIIELEPFTRQRTVRELNGSSTDIAKQIVHILKEEAKVL